MKPLAPVMSNVRKHVMTHSASQTIRFYFDYVSPNAYLAWSQIRGVSERLGVELEPVPVLFSAILDACGQRGPAEIPAKMQWMVKDVLRKAGQLRIPLKPPASHPFNPLLALRASLVPSSRTEAAALITAIFNAVWAEGIDVSDPSALSKAITRVGLEGSHLVEQAASAEIKSQLRNNTNAAVQAGVFGVPAMVVGSELFWGFDDFAHMEAYINGKDPLSSANSSAWANVRASAARKHVF